MRTGGICVLRTGAVEGSQESSFVCVALLIPQVRRVGSFVACTVDWSGAWRIQVLVIMWDTIWTGIGSDKIFSRVVLSPEA